MRQAEIWYANLNPIKGSEQAAHRPILIISGNMLNKYLEIVIVCPLTTKIKNYKGNLVIEPSIQNGLISTSEVLTFHIRSILKDRLIKKVGSITEDELKHIKNGLDDILRY